MPNKTNDNPIRILQLSDTHLFRNDETHLYGVKTNIKFKEVLQNINIKEHYDFIFLTGDLSQDETPESYQKLATELDGLNIPIYWTPGNHDNIPIMEDVFTNAKNFYNSRVLSTPFWNFIFLNTKLDQSAAGYLSNHELNELKTSISQKEEVKNYAIIMHHPPIETKNPIIDKYMLMNQEEFWNVLEGKNIKLIMSGHVHGEYKISYRNTMIETSPATCFQFKNEASTFGISNEIGYKSYHFFTNHYMSVAKQWESL